MPNQAASAHNMQKLQSILKKCPELQTLKPPGSDIEILETMGKGNYGYVFRGKIKSLQNVFSAIKVVFIKESELKETWQEVEILRECNHPNIVKYYSAFLQGLNLWVLLSIHWLILDNS
ncbi:Serine/threonine-protein kinase 4 [Coelomomyces lativittatus]|nr:Serine/threonine-protein kinase 4 [Coelomomyces lativittatus]KAJ1508625.1 Serine/threonine-protein kinase 4 [Coelomomyces lativittatus]